MISSDKNLKYIYDSNSFILSVDGVLYNLESQIIKKTRDIVYFTNIGAIAAAKIINSGIFPIKYKESVSIEEEIKKLTTMLNTNPPPFIKKIIEKKAA